MAENKIVVDLVNDFLLYLTVEKHYAKNTVNSYERDLYQLEHYLEDYESEAVLDNIDEIDASVFGLFKQPAFGKKHHFPQAFRLPQFLQIFDEKADCGSQPAF